MSRVGLFLLGLFFLAGCKKPEERKCWKSKGDDDTLTIPLDSVAHFSLGPNIKYRIYESDVRQLVVRGGSNMIQHVDALYSGTDLRIENQNSCHFLRKGARFVEVDIYYPHLRSFFIEASDSVIFCDTIYSDSININLRNGGGSLDLAVDNKYIEINVSRGAADYQLSGQSNRAIIKIQNNGFADATNFQAASIFAYQRSTADLYLNLDGAMSYVLLEGTGDVYYTGVPSDLVTNGKGSGKLIQF